MHGLASIPVKAVFLHSGHLPPIFWGMKNITKITLTVISTLFLTLFILLFVIAHYTLVFVLDTQSYGVIFPAEMNSKDPATGQQAVHREWMLLASSHQQLLSEDGLELHAYYIPAPKPSDLYVILCHGYRNSALSMAEYAYVYHRAGWNVLVLDHRSHGYSEGRFITMGWKEHEDLIMWIQQLVEHDSQAQVLLHGVSMGAATVMMACGSPSLPENVVAAVEDCGYTSVRDEFLDKIAPVMGFTAQPFLSFASLLNRIQSGYFLEEVNCVEAVSQSEIPILFIHGRRDDFVPFWMLEELYGAATCPKIKLVVPEAAHAQARLVNPQLYWSTVEFFVDRFFSPNKEKISSSANLVRFESN